MKKNKYFDMNFSKLIVLVYTSIVLIYWGILVWSIANFYLLHVMVFDVRGISSSHELIWNSYQDWMGLLLYIGILLALPIIFVEDSIKEEIKNLYKEGVR